jgi:hypothetical protein
MVKQSLVGDAWYSKSCDGARKLVHPHSLGLYLEVPLHLFAPFPSIFRAPISASEMLQNFHNSS